ncbi:MAG: acyl-CoA reductase [Candidatus Cyclobacteriaceae bacterium M3_2C_046]
MISLTERINAFIRLGERLNNLSDNEKEMIYSQARAHNGWFTRESIDKALEGICHYVDAQNLNFWLKNYEIELKPAQSIGLVLAGNIPLVGFHDFLCVILSGHNVMAKLSHQDPFLLKYIIDQLIDIEPGLAEQINLVERLKQMDAVIATGSDNTSRYFEYYFGKYPHIIRKNRTSLAILTGKETKAEIIGLGHDLFDYFGLGCRNVAKIFLPQSYSILELLPQLAAFEPIIANNKYANNYHYHRAVFLVNRIEHLDSGFVLWRQQEDLFSPTGVVYYDHYTDIEQVKTYKKLYLDKIQCTTSHHPEIEDKIPFGTAQQPGLADYADGVDTMKFLLQL